jgi:hypothetical protein
MADDVVWIVIDKPAQEEIQQGGRSGGGTGNPYLTPDTAEPEVRHQIPVKAEKLEQGVSEFLQVMGQVMRNAKNSAGELGAMELDEIELTVEVNGEGRLSLLGNGGKMGGKGAMTLKFKMTKPT